MAKDSYEITPEQFERLRRKLDEAYQTANLLKQPQYIPMPKPTSNSTSMELPLISTSVDQSLTKSKINQRKPTRTRSNSSPRRPRSRTPRTDPSRQRLCPTSWRMVWA